MITQAVVQVSLADQRGPLLGNPRQITFTVPFVDADGELLEEFDLRAALHAGVDEVSDEYDRLLPEVPHHE